jgi:hypothetical protein
MDVSNMARKFDVAFKSSDSIKITELNQILDKISFHKQLSDREKDFLFRFDSIEDSDFKDYHFLSLMDLFYIICKIEKSIICDIKDKNGRINQEIISIDYDYDNCKIHLTLKHTDYTLTDNYLYKLIYEFKHDNYSLDIESEYYEKIYDDK